MGFSSPLKPTAAALAAAVVCNEWEYVETLRPF